MMPRFIRPQTIKEKTGDNSRAGIKFPGKSADFEVVAYPKAFYFVALNLGGSYDPF
ncbi:MAG TPA: hypothetical protein PKE49_20035 [Leptospiraceae bacterium]|nr:hypothetical protein [Leptospirales bacterium]HMU85303.1 hypothetical protein [Leptospiraceae bacterium]HMX58827.1 hypothetical protein [Leptospiraceae bacterium]HNN76988.1 hypothetical protein [Leptospiraceae bacterium]